MSISILTRPTRPQASPLSPTLALSALISTVLLVLMGSIVRVTGYGLGCPDWPLCYGQAIPPAFTGAWVEFSHRLLGLVASVQIALVGVMAWRGGRKEKWVFWPAAVLLVSLAVQIVLGGLHVIYELPAFTGLVHTGAALLIVGLLAVIVADTLPVTRSLRLATGRAFHGTRFPVWMSLTTGATYLLLLTGSYVTRTGASLACPSFPLCGQVAPALQRLIDIQMLHRYTAYSVAFLTVVTVVWLLARGQHPGLKRYAWGMAGLITLQFGLGIANVLLRLPMWSRALHLTVGATFWAVVVILWTLVYTARQHEPAG